jgi:hypothetical protein
VHEVLILPDDGNQDLESLQFMVREINWTEVAPEDRLSDYVYHYDAQDHVLERAETFVERMAQKEQEAEKAVLQEPGKTAEPREAKMEDAREPDNSFCPAPDIFHSSSNRSSNSSGEYRVTPNPRKSFLFLVTIPSHLFDLAQVAIRQSSKSFALT